MKNAKRDMVRPEDEERAIANQGKVFLPGSCVPEEIQKLKIADKVAIVGFAPSWTSTPWDDETFDIWGINELYMQMIAKYGKECRYTHWWEIHNPYSPSKNSPKHHAWMAKCKVPMFMNKRYEEFPTSVVIPKDNIIDFYNQNFVIGEVGSSYSDYSNQISVMLALAIMMDYKEIHVYGVDMAQASEYCVSPDTRILMQDLTYKKAGELNQGDKIIAFEENFDSRNDDGKQKYRRYKLAEIENNKIIKRPCYRLTMSNGDELICSQEHQWLISGGNCKEHKKQIWQTTENIKENDIIIKPLDTWETLDTYDAGYLAAAFDGEGYLTITKRKIQDYTRCTLGFTQKDNEMLDRVLNNNCDLKFRDNMHSDGVCHNIYTDGGFPDILKTLGSIRPPRLLAGFKEKLALIENIQFKNKDKSYVVKKEFLGELDVVSTKTSTGTFIAEGYASHNSWQRSACQFFLGYAAGIGKKVLIPANSELCKYPNFYGFNTDNYARMQVKARINVIKESMKQINAQSMYEEYMRSSQRKTYAEQVHDLEVSLQRIDDELVKCDIVLNKNKELEAFLNDAPKESKEFNRKISNVLTSASKQNKTLEQQIADLEKNKKQFLDQKKQSEQQDFAWEIQYQDSKKNLQMNISGLQGIIGECKRLLDNNLV
jgi:hypothetical protein